MLRCGAFCQYRGSVAVNSSVMLHVLITWLIAGGTWALVTATLSTAGLRVLDTASLSSFVDVFNALVAFLLGLFVSISLGRWWAVLFNHYGGKLALKPAVVVIHVAQFRHALVSYAAGLRILVQDCGGPRIASPC